MPKIHKRRNRRPPTTGRDSDPRAYCPSLRRSSRRRRCPRSKASRWRMVSPRCAHTPQAPLSGHRAAWAGSRTGSPVKSTCVGSASEGNAECRAARAAGSHTRRRTVRRRLKGPGRLNASRGNPALLAAAPADGFRPTPRPASATVHGRTHPRSPGDAWREAGPRINAFPKRVTAFPAGRVAAPRARLAMPDEPPAHGRRHCKPGRSLHDRHRPAAHAARGRRSGQLTNCGITSRGRNSAISGMNMIGRTTAKNRA